MAWVAPKADAALPATWLRLFIEIASSGASALSTQALRYSFFIATKLVITLGKKARLSHELEDILRGAFEVVYSVTRNIIGQSRSRLVRLTTILTNGAVPTISEDGIDREVAVLDRIAMAHANLSKLTMPLATEWLVFKNRRRALLH